jgi:hypothetical protein
MFINLPSEFDRQNVIAYLGMLKNEAAGTVGSPLGPQVRSERPHRRSRLRALASDAG